MIRGHLNPHPNSTTLTDVMRIPMMPDSDSD